MGTSGGQGGSTRQRRGWRAEQVAARWLEGLGWRVVASNVWYRVGELDLVADDGEQLVFVEVRSRGGRARSAFRAADSVGYRKQMRLTRAAQLYWGRYAGPHRTARFDVVAVDADRGEVVEHLRSAFEAVGPEVF